jgi:hypothetical protein
MRSFFSPKGRLTVSRPLAHVINTLNLLTPTLLFTAVILLLCSKFGDHGHAVRQFLVQYAAVLVGASLVIRVVWGVAIRVIRNRTEPTHKT